MTKSNGEGRSEQLLNPPLWRALHEYLRADRNLTAQLYERIEARCRQYLKGQPIGILVAAEELADAVITKLISCPTLASRTDVRRFLDENGVEKTIARMANWSTSPKPLLGLAQQIAGRRWEQPAPCEDATDVADPRLWRDTGTDVPARLSELAEYLDAYVREIRSRLGDDAHAWTALGHVMAVVAQGGVDRCDEPATRLGLFDELPFGAIRDLANEDGADPQWTYETARSACQRLATADRATRKHAARAGFGEGPEALLGYLRLCIKTQSPGGGGLILPLVGEETKS